MSMDTLEDLLEEQVKDLYSAENQLLKALPRMAKKASTDGLKKAFETHLEQTREHAERLTQVCEMLDTKPGGKKCKAMEGLIEEGKEVLEEDGEAHVIDLALVGAAQRVEHYEIAGYGNVRTLAQKLGLDDVVKLLEQTLEEEKETDELLTEVSLNEIIPEHDAEGNDDAEASDEEEDDEVDVAEEDEAPESGTRRGGSAGGKKSGSKKR
ncbi:MAG: ferritin-like domain-containing protein [Tepidisphaeraceae bacterium]